MTNIPHIPVLPNEVLKAFESLTSGTLIDCTLGFGGHSELLLRQKPEISLIGIDRDAEAFAFASQRLEPFHGRTRLLSGPFSDKIKEIDWTEVSGLLADTGVSSLQLDHKERGFGFDSETLDMRMDKNASLSAYEVVNQYSLTDLEHLFKEYGEIREYRKMARIVSESRKVQPISSGRELAELIGRHFRKGKIHPATTLFQAIRIEVNDELGELTSLLDSIEQAQPKDTLVAIISFHSLEDRIVKNRFKEWGKNCICPLDVMRCSCGNNHAKGKILTKKPWTASDSEVRENPRSRSAKLRVFQFRQDR